MIVVDEYDLSWFLSRLVEDYAALSELYEMLDERTNEVTLLAVKAEIEDYQERAERHRAELSAFLGSCDPDPVLQPAADLRSFEAWAADNLGQGYPLARDEGVYENVVTRWAFAAWRAGRRELMEKK